jgi:hypothetical protein
MLSVAVFEIAARLHGSLVVGVGCSDLRRKMELLTEPIDIPDSLKRSDVQDA